MNLESPLWRRCYLHLRWYFFRCKITFTSGHYPNHLNPTHPPTTRQRNVAIAKVEKELEEGRMPKCWNCEELFFSGHRCWKDYKFRIILRFKTELLLIHEGRVSPWTNKVFRKIQGVFFYWASPKKNKVQNHVRYIDT